jgi:dipeptidyl aminopeptidase/acylaminoacyl peptidase
VISDSRERKGNGGLIYLHYRQNGTWPSEVTGFDVATEAGEIAQFEPLRNVAKGYPPTCLIHGTEDTDVPVEQSLAMAEEFKRHGIRHRLVTVPGGEHGLAGADSEQIQDAIKLARDFISRHLGTGGR